MASTASKSPNEGKGNKTAAREYNEAQQSFVRSGQIEEKAREAERALTGRSGANSSKPKQSEKAAAPAKTPH